TFYSLMNRGGIRQDHALQRTHVESALVVANSADDPADFFRPQFPAVTQSKAMQLSFLAGQHGSLDHVRSGAVRDRTEINAVAEHRKGRGGLQSEIVLPNHSPSIVVHGVKGSVPPAKENAPMR